MQKRLARFFFAGIFVAYLGGSLGCATTFQGDAEFPGGARGCFDRCQTLRMEMASYVFVGEYSTACACKPRVAQAALTGEDDSADQAAVVAAGAGVELQRRAMAEQRRRSSTPTTAPNLGK